MNYNIILSNQANTDICDIYEYVSTTLHEKQIAVNLIKLIEENILSLENMPGRYNLYDKEPWNTYGVRVMPVKNYLIFYNFETQNRTVNILRVIYGSRNLEKI